MYTTENRIRLSRNQSSPNNPPAGTSRSIGTRDPPRSAAIKTSVIAVRPRALFRRSHTLAVPSRNAVTRTTCDERADVGKRIAAPELGHGEPLGVVKAEDGPQTQNSERDRENAADPAVPERLGLASSSGKDAHEVVGRASRHPSELLSVHEPRRLPERRGHRRGVADRSVGNQSFQTRKELDRGEGNDCTSRSRCNTAARRERRDAANARRRLRMIPVRWRNRTNAGGLRMCAH